MAVQNNETGAGTPDVGDRASQLRQRIEARRAQMSQQAQEVQGAPQRAPQAVSPQAQARQPTEQPPGLQKPPPGGTAPQGGTALQGVQTSGQAGGQVTGQQGVPSNSLRKPPVGGGAAQPVAQTQAESPTAGTQPVSIGQQNSGNPSAPQPGELAGPNGQAQPNAGDLNARKKGLFAKGKQVKAQLDSIDPTTAQYLAIFFNNLLYSLFMSPLKTVSSVFTTYIVFEAKNRILNLLVTFGLVLAVPMLILAIWEYNWVLLAYPVGVVLAFDLLYVQSFWGGDSSIEKIDQIIAETTKGEQELEGFVQSGKTKFNGQVAEGATQGSSDLQGVRYATADQLQELTTPSSESSVEEFDDDYLL